MRLVRRQIAIAPTTHPEAMRGIAVAQLDWCDLNCSTCERRLCVIGRSRLPHLITDGHPRLPVADYCRFCSRPISDAAQRRAPLAGFIALAKAFSGDRHPAFAHGRTRESA